MKRISFAVALLAVLAWATGASAAVARLDQAQQYADATLVMPPGLAQTFVVGRTGKLSALSLTSPGGAPVVLQLYTLRPDGTPDVSHPLLPSNQTVALMPGAATMVSVAPTPVKRGEQLALALGTVRSTASADLAVGVGDRYPAGQLFQVSGAFAFQPVAGGDLTFSTYVGR